MNTFTNLFASRKAMVGTLTVAAIVAAATLVALGKLPAEQFVPTISAITAVGLGVIGGIAFEDGAAKGAGGSAAPPPAPVAETAVQVINVAQPEALPKEPKDPLIRG